MFLDASAIIAMLGDEVEGDAFADALSAASVRLTSPIAVWESVAGLAHEYALSIPEARRKLAEMVEEGALTPDDAKLDPVPPPKLVPAQ